MPDLVGWKKGGTEGLGQAIHQKHRGIGQGRLQLRRGRHRHGAAGVGDVTQGGDGFVRPGQAGELVPQRRYRRQAGDGITGDGADHVAWQQVVHQHDGCTDRKRRGQLTQAVIETERQYRQQAIGCAVVEIAGDALRAREHIAMRQHHALGSPCAARGVQDRCHIGIDPPQIGKLHRAEHLLPAAHRQIAVRERLGRVAVGDHQLLQIRAILQGVLQQACAVGAGDQYAGGAITQDMPDLFRFEDRVDRHEHTACRHRAEHRRHGLELLRQVDGDTLITCHTDAPQAGCDPAHFLMQLPIVPGVLLEQQGGGIRCTLCGLQNQLVEQKGHGNAAVFSKAGLYRQGSGKQPGTLGVGTAVPVPRHDVVGRCSLCRAAGHHRPRAAVGSGGRHLSA